MKSEETAQLFGKVEAVAIEFNGVECWSARELQELLGYSRWENFEKVVSKAKEACHGAGERIADHFPDVTKMVDIGSGAERPIEDVLLTRYACYLTAQNGDSRKEEVAFAQNCFAIQTRRAELVEQRLLDYERVKARKKLSQTENNLSGALYERGVDSQGFAVFRSKGDPLFNISTLPLKCKMGVPDNQAVREMLLKRGIVPENLPSSRGC